jgi:DNA-binding transcriptional regulator LsrR (DeoR family)
MCHMSKMAELALEIEDMYFDEHLDIPEIAKVTGLSVEDITSYFDEMKEQDECDESMDGDFDSAMASAGFGTDEDYGFAEDML